MPRASVQFNIRIPRSLKRRIDALRKAMPRGSTFNASDAVREALESVVGRLEKDHGKTR